MKRYIIELIDRIFQSPEHSISHKIVNVSFIIVLFFLGMIHWMLFFNLGQVSFKAYDWPKEFKYYSVLQQAIKLHRMPYYLSESIQYTTKFLAIPETVISPQIFLLKYLKVNQFIIAHFLLLYTLGFLGCLLIKKRYHLSIFSFGLLYLLFNFNGHITSHLAVGHSMWGGYFLLPYFFLFILCLIEGSFTISTGILLSLTLFFIFLQGSFHLYVWCIFFLLFLGLGKRCYTKPILLTIIASLFFSSFRLLPAMVTFFHQKHIFITGYHTIQILLDALITIRPPTYHLGILKGEGYFAPGWWEYDIYIGLLGLFFLLFGLFLHFQKKEGVSNGYHDLNIPIIGQTILSIGAFYAIFTILPFPLIGSERVSSRFLIIPLLMVTILSSIYVQNFLVRYSLREKKGILFFALLGIIQMGYSLIVHSITWSLMTIENGIQDKIVDMSIPTITTTQGPQNYYLLSLKIGVVISATALIIALGITCILYFLPSAFRKFQPGFRSLVN